MRDKVWDYYESFELGAVQPLLSMRLFSLQSSFERSIPIKPENLSKQT